MTTDHETSRAESDLENVGFHEEAASRRSRAPASTGTKAASRFHTLIVEDDQAEACLLRKFLEDASQGYPSVGHFSAEWTSTLAAALARLSTGSVDAIVLDLGLPDSQGLATLRMIREAARDAAIVVIASTSELELGLDALGLGAQNMLPKDELGPGTIARTLRCAIERRRIETELLATIREKEILLRELNHRAKNNLQVVGALLSMQARRSEDEGFRALVAAARSRIEAMARAHERLRSSNDLSRIDFSFYLRDLASSIYSSHGGESRGIALELDIEQHELSLERAVTAGLIVNELLTNAFKHAFDADREGRIWLRFRGDDKLLELLVEDNGRGMAGAEPGTRAEVGLGLGLVATLAEQLDAALDCDSGPGTRLRLTFPRGDSA
ncbi:MAG TPA: histidine kinase dimerization/phosphoacceptor domain -containing protein [Polyangiaceae bacterium]|nr:histidine kinase dimerization/phosphoacceptor domain -containing protein [Polyangiaceae bacterium]